MRWDELFDDLEAQLEQGLEIDEHELRAEDERLRLGRLSLRDRLCALASAAEGEGAGDGAGVRPLAVHVRDGSALRLGVTMIGRDWLLGALVDAIALPSAIVPFSACDSIALDAARVGVSLQSPPERPRLTDRLGLAFAMRDLCRRRASVAILAAGSETHGTIDRVGRDHLDLAVHEPGTPRRGVESLRIVRLDAITTVRF